MKKYLWMFLIFLSGVLLGSKDKIKDEIQKLPGHYERKRLNIDFRFEANSYNILVRTIMHFKDDERTAALIVPKGFQRPVAFFQNGQMSEDFLGRHQLRPKSLFFGKAGGLKAIFPVGESWYVLFSAKENECYRAQVVSFKENTEIFSGDCLPDPSNIDFNGMGGGWVQRPEGTFLAVGAPEGFSPVIRKLAQDPKNIYGKILLLNGNSKDLTIQHKVYATGFRNPQGLAFNPGFGLFSVEHGPRGGDEINRVESGKNYGWPLASLGRSYGDHPDSISVPYESDHMKFGAIPPEYSFVPSIGLSQISECPDFIFDGQCFLILSLKQTTMYALRFTKTKNGPRIASIESLIETPHRLRHFARNQDGSLFTKDRKIYVSADRHGVLEFSFESLLWKPEGPATEANLALANADPLFQRGRLIYTQHCITCHNTDPKSPGTTGPEIAGSSQDLIESKLLKGKYPLFYSPKRPTTSMPIMSFLANDAEALAAYLNHL